MPEITHILFDCDNTLVLSEDLAFEACADLINTIFKEKGRESEANYTRKILIDEYVGQNFRGMLNTLKDRKGLDVTPDEIEKYVGMEEDAVISKLKAALVACPGVDEQLESLKDKYTYAVVSSSAFRRLRASVDKVDQAKYFPEDRTFSAATSLPVPTSKPDPAIYLHALDKLGCKAENAVAIEDSKSGALSGTRAGIKVIGYTGPYSAEEKEEKTQILKDAGAVIIMDNWSEFPAALAKIAAGEV